MARTHVVISTSINNYSEIMVLLSPQSQVNIVIFQYYQLNN